MSDEQKTKLINLNICVARARKLLADKNYNAIPELVEYYDRYINDAASLEKEFYETGLGRYEILAEFKHKVAEEIVKCIEGLNAIRITDSFENDSFKEAVRRLK